MKTVFEIPFGLAVAHQNDHAALPGESLASFIIQDFPISESVRQIFLCQVLENPLLISI
jgi:hypothetical protein